MPLLNCNISSYLKLTVTRTGKDGEGKENTPRWDSGHVLPIFLKTGLALLKTLTSNRKGTFFFPEALLKFFLKKYNNKYWIILRKVISENKEKETYQETQIRQLLIKLPYLLCRYKDKKKYNQTRVSENRPCFMIVWGVWMTSSLQNWS